MRAIRAVRNGARSGVSLLSMLLSLLAITVGASIAIPAFFERPDVTLDNACVLLTRDLRAAQNRAAYLRQPLVFRFEEDGYRVTDSRGGPALAPCGPRTLDRSYGENTIFEGVSIETVELGEDSSLVFTARGDATEGGRVILEFRGHRRWVEVERCSGLTRIQGLKRPLPDGLD